MDHSAQLCINRNLAGTGLDLDVKHLDRVSTVDHSEGNDRLTSRGFLLNQPEAVDHVIASPDGRAVAVDHELEIEEFSSFIVTDNGPAISGWLFRRLRRDSYGLVGRCGLNGRQSYLLSFVRSMRPNEPAFRQRVDQTSYSRNESSNSSKDSRDSGKERFLFAHSSFNLQGLES